MTNPIAFYVFIALFAISSFVHLAFCFLENEKMRAITKCFPLVFLAVAAFVGFPNVPMLGIALICGAIGDAVLLRKKDRGVLLLLGAMFFMVNHALFIASMLTLAGPLEIGYYIALGCYYVLFLAMIPLSLKIVKKVYLGIGMALYFAALTSDTLVSIFLLVNGHQGLFFLALGGAFMFLLSDSILGYTMFKKDIKRRDFYIMLTYLGAQVLIFCGIVFGLIG